MEFTCQFCGSERKSIYSLKSHEYKCPSNINRKYVNGMTGKKGSNQFSHAKKHNLPQPQPNITKGMLDKNHSDESKKKISESQKKNHLSGISYNRGRWKFYKENPEKICFLYLAVFTFDEISFLKIGVTEKCFHHRYKNKMYEKYSKNLICEYQMLGLDALQLERNLLNKYKPYHQFNIKQIDESFVGHTECLSLEVLNDIITELRSAHGECMDSKTAT